MKREYMALETAELMKRVRVGKPVAQLPRFARVDMAVSALNNPPLHAPPKVF